MLIIKQYVKESTDDSWTCPAKVLLRSDGYGKSLALMNELFAVAKKDFPFLREEDVQVAHWGGIQIKGIMGIEFPLPGGYPVPDCYGEIKSLPPTL